MSATKPWDPQPCNNGCGTTIKLAKQSNGKWLPVDVSTNVVHDCPKSKWNLSHPKPQPQTQAQPQKGTLDATLVGEPFTVGDLNIKIKEILDITNKTFKQCEAIYDSFAKNAMDDTLGKGEDINVKIKNLYDENIDLKDVITKKQVQIVQLQEVIRKYEESGANFVKASDTEAVKKLANS